MSAHSKSSRHRNPIGRTRMAASMVLLLSAGSALAVTPAADASAQLPVQPRSSASDPHAVHVAEAARRFGLPESWIRAVLRAESAGDARAVSSAGAIGLMQVMPHTFAALRIRYRLGRDPHVPRDNILAGTAYLREMYDRYGNIAAMLAAYNAGPGRYDEFRATGRPLPAETRGYVARLAPRLGGAPSPQRADRASAPPRDWWRAPLFAVRSSDARNDIDASARPQPGTTVLAPKDAGASP